MALGSLSRHLVRWLALLTAGAAMGLAATYLYLDPQVPRAESYRTLRLQTPLRIFSADGAFLGEFGERRRIPLPREAFPELFVKAVLDTEDKRFYRHHGIDWITLGKAIVLLVANPGEIGPGGSTITMQLARNISFTLEQTFIRKFKEMLLALKLEQALSKDEILALYLNVIPFGKRAYGAEAAALTYYGKPLAELTLAQWAMLAGIPQAPSIGNPINGPERALRRRNVVLANMLRQGSIDRTTYEAARNAPLTASLHDRVIELDAPWAAEMARREILAQYGRSAYEDGLEVYTTLRSAEQAAAQRALRLGLRAYDERHGYRGPERILTPPEPEARETGSHLPRWQATVAERPVLGELVPAIVIDLTATHFVALLGTGEQVSVTLDAMQWARPYLSENARGRRPNAPGDVVSVGHIVRLAFEQGRWKLAQLPQVQGAVVAIDPDDGALRALAGGFDFAANQFNHATQAARQPGSNFKPFLYAAALDAGRTPASIYLDAPLVFEDRNLEGLYRPRNDSGEFSGPLRLREALTRSVNLVSMRLLLDIGVDQAIGYADRLGFNTAAFPRSLQLAIGGGTMALTPLDVVKGFALFANGGYAVEPYLIDRVTLQGGETLFEAAPLAACPEPCPGRPEALKAPAVMEPRVAYQMHSLLGDVIRYGTGRRALSLKRSDLGGKTGTTNAADTWFSGYQRSLAATVWVGFPDNSPLGNGEFGSNTALPIWIDFMETALKGVPEYRPIQPPGLIQVRIDPTTGEATAPGSREGIFEVFREEYAPAPAASKADAARPEEIF
ncbi:MAG: PBP1A family penicillin-binding protein [Pseudomonadales bacterium]|nr:PBP1A family penicillin-binding protein [Pseudomonadales bacterium]MBL6808388.1 PBP1A family penicillin-binding protein [Pseudomonadales bacterium]